MFMRERRRARFVYIDDTSRESEAPPVELSECSPDPESALASCELKRILRTEIRRVPPLLRNVIMLRDIQGLPMTAVAEALHISVPAAKSRLLRARTELRLRLKQRHDNTGSLSSLSRSASHTQTAHPPARNEQYVGKSAQTPPGDGDGSCRHLRRDAVRRTIPIGVRVPGIAEKDVAYLPVFER